VLVFEDQFIEIVTNMVNDYNVYGLAENIRNFRLGNNYTQTLFNADSADSLDENAYGTHPFYQETRYYDGTLMNYTLSNHEDDMLIIRQVNLLLHTACTLVTHMLKSG
jgi:alpha-glucosidase (family GH31 glycosyl hydrolase)